MQKYVGQTFLLEKYTIFGYSTLNFVLYNLNAICKNVYSLQMINSSGELELRSRKECSPST